MITYFVKIALRGEICYQVTLDTEYVSHNPTYPCWKVLGVHHAEGTSLAGALLPILRKETFSKFHGISAIRIGHSIQIEKVIAYPCRLARWIFSRKFRRQIFIDFRDACLLIQSREITRKEPNADLFPWLMPQVANDLADLSSPQNTTAQNAVGGKESIAMNDHAADLAEGSEVDNEKSNASDTGNIGENGGFDRIRATGLYRMSDGSMVTHIEVGSESEILASRSRATGVCDKAFQHEGITPQGCVGVLTHPLQIVFKFFNALKSFGHLTLQCLKGGCVHGGESAQITEQPEAGDEKPHASHGAKING